jgi:hypothetical protein
LAKEPLACQIIGNHPNKDQSFGYGASFGLNPNKPLGMSPDVGREVYVTTDNGAEVGLHNFAS